MTLEEYNKAVDLYADNLYRFILKNCRNDQMAQDIVQDSFEKMWMKIDQVDGEKTKSYLFTTGYHTMLDILKKDKRITDLNETATNSHYSSEQYSDVEEIIRDALE